MSFDNMSKTVYFTVMAVTVVAVFALGIHSSGIDAKLRAERIAVEEAEWQEIRQRCKGVLGRDYKGCLSREGADVRGIR